MLGTAVALLGVAAFLAFSGRLPFGYVFDKEARLRLIMPHDRTADDRVRDPRRLI